MVTARKGRRIAMVRMGVGMIGIGVRKGQDENGVYERKG
jgi:hypothetical protein